VDEDADAGWRDGSSVEVVAAMELGVGGELGVDAGATEEVESQQCLGQEAIPQVHGKFFVQATEPCDEVILERADGAFRGIATMDARRNKLEVDGFFDKKFFQCDGALVVESLELGTEAGGGEGGMELLVAGEDDGAGAVPEGLGEDGVAVVVVEDKQIIVAVAGGRYEATGLISVDLACGFHDGCVADVATLIGGIAGGKDIVGEGRWLGIGSGRWRRRGTWVFSGGTLVFPGLVHVAFNHSGGLRRVFSKEGRGEAGEIGEVSFVEREVQGGEGGGVQGGVGESDKLGGGSRTDGGVGSGKGRRRQGWRDWEIEMPQERGGSAVAGEDDVVIVGDSDGRSGESNEASSIAQLSHGDEGELL
jgi:hypothetical protein